MSKYQKNRRRVKLCGAIISLALVAVACGSDDKAEPAATDAPAASEAPAATEAPAVTEAPAATEAPSETEAPAPSGGALKLGIMAECEGAFGGFNEDVVAGATLAMINNAGATSNSRTTALDGFTNASAGGLSIDVVGVGCGNDTADRAIQEIRKLVEQDGAEVVLGPLSGDEGIAIANYAKDHPEVTFINGISGAQEATLQVQAPNFFRFTGDGAQWNAGMGDILHNTAGWDTAVVIADDYGFGWTSAAGFIAEFCAVGGNVVQRVFPPLNTTDYSSFIAQLPDPSEVDGYFWVVGGTGTQASLEAFVNAKGELNGQQHAGNLFFNPGLASALGPGIAGAYVGGFASLAGDVQTPEIKAYAASADAAWDTLAGALTGNEPGPPSTALTFGFAYGYYLAGTALIQALNEVDGDLSDNHKALNDALANMTLEGPFGKVTLDENRQAIIDTSVQQLVLDGDEVVSKTVALIRGVDQTFGGTFSATTPPPGRDAPACEARELPWVGKAVPVVDGVPQG